MDSRYFVRNTVKKVEPPVGSNLPVFVTAEIKPHLRTTLFNWAWRELTEYAVNVLGYDKETDTYPQAPDSLQLEVYRTVFSDYISAFGKIRMAQVGNEYGISHLLDLAVDDYAHLNKIFEAVTEANPVLRPQAELEAEQVTQPEALDESGKEKTDEQLSFLG